MTPAVVIRAGWLDDPVARRAGVGVVALVLALAAQSAQRGQPGIIAEADWRSDVEADDAERAERVGLVRREALPAGGFVVRCSPWLLSQLDTDKAISTRRLTRLRVQRLRQRQRYTAADTAQLALPFGRPSALPLFDTPPRTQPAASVTPDVFHRPAAPNECTPQGVTRQAVTLFAPSQCKNTLSTAQARARILEPRDQCSSHATRVHKISAPAAVEKPPEQPATERPTFGHVLAIVGGSVCSTRRALNDDERRRLLDDVKATCRQARFEVPTDATIRSAISIYERRQA